VLCACWLGCRALRAQVEAVDAEAAPAGAGADDAEAEAQERARKRPRLSQELRCGGGPRTLAVIPAVCHATHHCHGAARCSQVRPMYILAPLPLGQQFGEVSGAGVWPKGGHAGSA